MASPGGISVLDGYRAMNEFLDAYWERGGRTSDELAMILGAMALSSDGMSMDPAMLSDWRAAVSKVAGEGSIEKS